MSTSRHPADLSTFRLRRRTPGPFILVPCPAEGRSIRCQGHLEADAALTLSACPRLARLWEQPFVVWYAWRPAPGGCQIRLLDGPPARRPRKTDPVRVTYVDLFRVRTRIDEDGVAAGGVGGVDRCLDGGEITDAGHGIDDKRRRHRAVFQRLRVRATTRPVTVILAFSGGTGRAAPAPSVAARSAGFFCRSEVTVCDSCPALPRAGSGGAVGRVSAARPSVPASSSASGAINRRGTLMARSVLAARAAACAETTAAGDCPAADSSAACVAARVSLAGTAAPVARGSVAASSAPERLSPRRVSRARKRSRPRSSRRLSVPSEHPRARAASSRVMPSR